VSDQFFEHKISINFFSNTGKLNTHKIMWQVYGEEAMGRTLYMI
jgi:hypothetical protein